MTELEVGHGNGGFTLRLRVSPNARNNKIASVYAGALKVMVRQPPDKGRANEAVCKLLADALDLAPRDIEVVAGHTSRDKKVAIAFRGTQDELESRLLR